jgi:hypothetical protein
LATTRAHFFLVTTLANNTATTYTDNTADSGLPGTTPPAANTAASYTYKLTHVSDSGESEAGSASGGVIIADKAAAGKCDLANILAGPTGTTARKIYRTKAGFGSVGPWYYHSTIADNATVVLVDNTPDSSLSAELCPSFIPANWTGTEGWSADTTVLTKITDTVPGTITPSGITANPVAGQSYQVVITASAVSGTVTYTYGGVAGTAITATTITDTIKTLTTAKLIITGGISSTATITAISIIQVAPAADWAWMGIIAEKAYLMADAILTALSSTGADTAKPSFPYISASGATTYKGLTKTEWFTKEAENGFVTDNTNYGVHSDAQLAAHGAAAAAALIVALNA